jgi:hypothetical protein
MLSLHQALSGSVTGRIVIAPLQQTIGKTKITADSAGFIAIDFALDVWLFL